MKKAWALVILLTAGCAAETAPGAVNAPDRGLSAPQGITQFNAPQGITQFYRDWNYAVSFSTPAERSRLRLVDDLEEAEGLSQRLKSVGRRLTSIESKIRKIDSGMVEFGAPRHLSRFCPILVEEQNSAEPFLACKSPRKEVEAPRLRPRGFPVAAELAKLVGIEKDGPAMAVRVKLWPLLPPDNALLVASYEKWPEKTPPPNVQQLKPLIRSGPRTEIHTWTLVGGRWMRNEANLVLLRN